MSIDVCATRPVYLNGPTHTGWSPKLAPSAASAAGDMIMPARSASAAVIGANGCLKCSTTCPSSGASMLVSGPISVRRAEPFSVRWRCRLVRTAAASNGVPSANRAPVRTPNDTVRPSGETVGSPAASCGTTVPAASRS